MSKELSTKLRTWAGRLQNVHMLLARELIQEAERLEFVSSNPTPPLASSSNVEVLLPCVEWCDHTAEHSPDCPAHYRAAVALAFAAKGEEATRAERERCADIAIASSGQDYELAKKWEGTLVTRSRKYKYSALTAEVIAAAIQAPVAEEK